LKRGRDVYLQRVGAVLLHLSDWCFLQDIWFVAVWHKNLMRPLVGAAPLDLANLGLTPRVRGASSTGEIPSSTSSNVIHFITWRIGSLHCPVQGKCTELVILALKASRS
jgi:hypothetical protein